MQNYKHILLATDFSTQSDLVADTALNLAQRAKAKLSIVHVIEHTPVVYGGGEFSVPLDVNLEEVIRDSAQELLANLGKRLNVPIEQQYLKIGPTKKAILELAKSTHVDLIVIGSHGRHGLDIMLGSTANAVLHGAHCDVFAVRIKEKK